MDSDLIQDFLKLGICPGFSSADLVRYPGLNGPYDIRQLNGYTVMSLSSDLGLDDITKIVSLGCNYSVNIVAEGEMYNPVILLYLKRIKALSSPT